MPTGPEAFIELPVACDLMSCDRTHLKMALCYIRTLVKRMINAVRFFSKKHLGACSGLRFRAWLHKRNNDRLEAIRLPVLAGLPLGGRATLMTPFVAYIWY